MSALEDLYRPIKRIRQACQNCRRKKARCTGERPECAFCVRLGQTCIYSDEEPYQNSNSSSSDKKRGEATMVDLSDRLSCLENQMSDVAQTLRNIATTVQNISRKLSNNNSNDSNSSQSEEPLEATLEGNQDFTTLPSKDLIRSTADLYFKFCHNQPYSLFHEDSLREKIEVDEVPTHLLFALLASTVRYSDDPYFEDKSAAVSAYASQSWKSIVMPWNGIQSETELSIVQTILLLAIIDYTDGRTQGSWIKVGLAIRLAQDFRLQIEPENDLSPIQQEERRRVFWSFYLCDKLISCGRERPAVILDEQCRLQLPIDENEFRNGNYQQTPTLEHLIEENAFPVISTLSPFAVAAVMASLLGRCAQYTLGEHKEQTTSGKTLLWNLRSKYSSIHSSLLQIEPELGLSESLAEKITKHFTSSDGTIDQHRAAPLVLSHAMFYLCQCLLYHPFLLRQRLMRLGQRSPQSFLSQIFHSCRAAATSLSQLMDEVKSLCCETLSTSHDPFYGYCTMVAGTIHSMFLQSSDPLIVHEASASLESSLQNLLELSCYWKSCGMMRSRLQEFRDSNAKYSQLVEPTIQEVNLSSADANDLLECLDYSRMSTTPRRKSEPNSTSQLATMSQLPSPFFDEFINLLPISYTRPMNTFPENGDIFSNQAIFDSANAFIPTSVSMPIYNSAPLQAQMSNHMGSNITPSNPPHSNSMPVPDLSRNQTANSTTNFSPTSSYGISPSRRESFPHLPNLTSGEMNFMAMSQGGTMNARRLTSPSVSMKRPWYETST